MRHLTLLIGLLLPVSSLAANEPLVAALVSCSFSMGQPAVVIHEWGTFTSLQNEKGDAIGGINVDTERLPAFVHNFAPHILPNAPAPGSKGLPTPQPRLDVTMRLETPVVYFHLPPDAPRPQTLDLEVRFRGGWLTQFYPDAEADIDGRPVGNRPLEPMPHLSGASADPEVFTAGGLAWRGLQVGVDAAVPVTTSRVWVAPRDVQCDRVTTVKGESEQYLFYRGVGHLDAPLRVSRLDDQQDWLQICGQMRSSSDATIPRLWLVDVAAGGRLAFHGVGPLQIGSAAVPLAVRSIFDESEYTRSSLTTLQDELRAALVADGLFRDEADALLRTWEHSYFRDEGLRLLFLVPREWTDAHLPIRVSVPGEIRRSMVGRIEIVTPGQREALRQLAAIRPDLPDREYFAQAGPAHRRLGRFAAALILDEQRTRPSDALATYIRRARLEPFKPVAAVPHPAQPDRFARQ